MRNQCLKGEALALEKQEADDAIQEGRGAAAQGHHAQARLLRGAQQPRGRDASTSAATTRPSRSRRRRSRTSSIASRTPPRATSGRRTWRSTTWCARPRRCGRRCSSSPSFASVVTGWRRSTTSSRSTTTPPRRSSRSTGDKACPIQEAYHLAGMVALRRERSRTGGPRCSGDASSWRRELPGERVQIGAVMPARNTLHARAEAMNRESHVGVFLRTQREARGMTVAQLSRATKIKESSLVALEEERFDALPARVFVVGWVGAVRARGRRRSRRGVALLIGGSGRRRACTGSASACRRSWPRRPRHRRRRGRTAARRRGASASSSWCSCC